MAFFHVVIRSEKTLGHLEDKVCCCSATAFKLFASSVLGKSYRIIRLEGSLLVQHPT